MAVTINEIADEAEVSQSTVSRILNKSNKYSFKEDTEKKVLRVAREMNYHPNHFARGLKTGKSHTIGLIVADITTHFFGEIVRSAELAAKKFGYNTIICNTDEDLETEISYVNMLKQKRVDGFIISPSQVSEEHLSDLKREGSPLVLIDRYVDDIETSYVIVDNENGVYQGITHLIKLGHKKIGYISGRKEESSMQDRLKGHKRALEENGLSGMEEYIISGSGSSKVTGEDGTKRLLTMNEPPTAIFGTNELITIGIMKAVKELGLRIPEQIAIVGFDDFDLASLIEAPLTVVSQPTERIGEEAVRILIDELLGKSNYCQKIVLNTQFIVRSSCGAKRFE